MPGMLTCHQYCAGWRADGISKVVVGELHPLIGNAVNVWGFQFFLFLTAEVTVAEIIYENVVTLG